MFRLPSDRNLIAAFVPFLAPTVLVVLGIFLFLFIETVPALRAHRLTEYFGAVLWEPSSGQFGLLPMLLGSLLCSALALALAVPISVLTAGYLCFFSSKWLSAVLTRLTELMAATPSVVYGVWGLVVLVPLVGSIKAPGTSLLTGSIILSAMLIPTLVLHIRVDFAYASKELRRVCAASGLHPFTAFWQVHLPSSAQGVVNAAVLSMGRALGETIALLMVTGNVPAMPSGLLDSVRTLTSNIALEMSYALGTHRSALFLSGLVLMVVVLFVMLAAHFLRKALVRGAA